MLQKWTQSSLILRIFCGLVLGAILGLLVPQWTGIGILGQVFVGALKAVAPILVAVLVMSSIARAKGGLGPRFRTVIILYLLTTFIAALVAVSGSFLFPVTIDLKGGEAGELPGGLADIFAGLLNNMVANPVLSLTTANYMGILFWSVIIGVAIRITRSQTVITFMGELSNVVSLAVKWIIQFAPFGILGLVFSSVSEGGLEIFTDYGRLLLLLVGCMLVTSLIVNPLLATIFLRKNPYPLLWQCLKESGISAFFTRSSAANIPMNMALCKKLGLDEEFYSVSIPLGSTINMDGAAVTITVLTLAVANTLGMDVSFGSALLLSVLATLGACGASGVAGGSLLLVPMACSLYGIPQDIAMQAVAVGFVISVIQDSVETALNSSGDAFFTAVAELHDRRKQKK
ncbi:MAG: serine/threonine transporter SstT [Bacteroidales bacterium]|nr:serine/threonine transporter SstT [Bacteroidales bacterium]MBQ4169132.1 serine/threonine transporter SstT [Bacteroidales bacterium]